MYQVIVMYGDNEPWWFLKDGRQIFKRRSHLHLLRKHSHFTKKMARDSERVFVHKCKTNFMTAFGMKTKNAGVKNATIISNNILGWHYLKNTNKSSMKAGKIFMKQLILAEKPSVAKDLSKVLGCNQK